MDDWVKAGKIGGEAREYGKKLIKVGASLLDVTEKVEDKIIKLGGVPAFPVDLSINDMAAHYSALVDDKTVFSDNDVVKLDLGVSVNGAMSDTACTVDLGGKYKDLIKASEEALKEALKIVKPGVRVCDIGDVVQKKISEFGFSPIKNLGGHGLDKYQVHSKPSIPNFDNGDKTELEKGQIVAIEPFASTGVGMVMEGRPSEVYMLINKKPIRDMTARKILKFVDETYRGMPFHKRWLIKKFNKVQITLNNMERLGILKQFGQLPERSKGIVSQTEHSILIDDKIKILTEV